jgi:hypothetical protein
LEIISLARVSSSSLACTDKRFFNATLDFICRALQEYK